MKSFFLVWLYVCLCPAFWAASGPAGDIPPTARNPLVDDPAILKRARAANEDVYSSLQSFVCSEEIDRFKGKLNGQSVKALDKVTAKLSFERGIEQYSDILQNQRPRSGMSSLAGAWSEGEFGTLLLQTQRLLGTQKVDFDSYASVKDEQAAIYHFDVSAEESPWDLAVANRHFRLAFRTNVWISVNTGEILRIERVTIGLEQATGISEIQWSILLEHFSLNGKTWLLPATGSYAVIYNESHHREWNEIRFAGYQRYSSEALLRFE